MKATVEVVCYKSKPLKDGTFPLMLRVTKDRKRKYVSLGLSLHEKFWDFEKSKPKRNCPNKEQIERLIAAKTAEYNDLIVEMTAQQREYTVETLVSHFHNQVRCATVVELYDKLIDDMKRGGKLGNAGVYKYSRTSLLKFTGQRLQIPFSDIDAVWLRRYENWLRTSGCGDTTISQLFRTLRSVFNKAVELQLVKRDYYPFDAYKVSKFDTRTKKRAITKEDVRKVIALDLSQGYPSERLARDIFVFSYFGAGINFADIALLKYGNVRDGRVQYVRKKTGKPINFLLTEEMRNIIAKYQRQGQTDEDYIFPILDRRVHRTEQQRYDRTHKVLTNTNRWLRKIGQRVGIEHLTTYVARHTFATVLKRSGVNIAIISESLGHSDLSTTQIYLDSFENSQIDAAMVHLL
ncbi:phage integrase SAM-like domain-containing protein [Alistipes shahii]|jgi:integrase|uniref:phage integrase SAM-like domain-containing protein n=1 Tax=Alistipes shahii TaxID=328814 RepID=UPI0035214E6C